MRNKIFDPLTVQFYVSGGLPVVPSIVDVDAADEDLDSDRPHEAGRGTEEPRKRVRDLLQGSRHKQGPEAVLGAVISTDDEVLNVREAAKVLKIPVWSLYAAANRHELPHRRIGRRWLFSRQALMRWLQGASPRDVGEE